MNRISPHPAKTTRTAAGRRLVLVCGLLLAALAVTTTVPVLSTAAFFTDRETVAGNTVAAATLAAPAGPVPTPAATSIDLAWEPARTTPDIQYTLERSDAAAGTDPVTIHQGTDLAVTDSEGQAPTPTTVAMTPVDVGETHSCGIADGAAYCWGRGEHGRLGNNSTADSPVPVPVHTTAFLKDATVSAVSAGYEHTCAVAGGAVYCWGRNGSGQLGNGTTTGSAVPVAVDTTGVLAGKTVTAIEAGSYHTCALADGAGYCWGTNSHGQLGNGTTSQSAVPVAVTAAAGKLAGKTVTAISTVQYHTCALADETAYCWGYNAYGQLGDGNGSDSTVPVAVSTANMPAGRTVTALSAGFIHACAVAGDAVYCWGSGVHGHLGDGTGSSSTVPVAVSTANMPAGGTVTALSADFDHTCAVAGGAAYCWGENTFGQLGNGSTTTSSVPVAVEASGVLAGKALTSISAGQFQTCATASGAAYCWGNNRYGQLGDGTTTPSTVPVTVQAVTGAAECPAGAVKQTDTTCSLTPGTTYYYRLSYTIGQWLSPAGDWMPATTGSTSGTG